MGQVAAD